MKTQDVWRTYGQELYFFILKRVKDQHVAEDVLQNCFLKIHKNLQQLADERKTRAWIFQISRNEIVNYYNKKEGLTRLENEPAEEIPSTIHEICCFDQFITELPDAYRHVIELTYLQGKTQKEVAGQLGLSLANVKARTRRAKAILKERFQTCCQYELDPQGNLRGSSNCAQCSG
ncbi:MAG: sigma-70 family RNA polymerase sigma factor [Bacteroidota bacterium]